MIEITEYEKKSKFNKHRFLLWSIIGFLFYMLFLSKIANGQSLNIKDMGIQLVKDETWQYENQITEFYGDENIIYSANENNFYDINLNDSSTVIILDNGFINWSNAEYIRIKGYSATPSIIYFNFSYSTIYTDNSSVGFFDYGEKHEMLTENKTFNYYNWGFFNNWQYSTYYNNQIYYKRYTKRNDTPGSNEYINASDTEWSRIDRDIYDDYNSYSVNVDGAFSIFIDIIDIEMNNENNGNFEYFICESEKNINLKLEDIILYSKNNLFDVISIDDTTDITIYPNNNFEQTFYLERNNENFDSNFGFSYLLSNETIKDVNTYTENYGFGVFPSWQYDISEHYWFFNNTLAENEGIKTFFTYAVDEDMDDVLDSNMTYQVFLNPDHIYIKYRVGYNYVDSDNYYYPISTLSIYHNGVGIKTYLGYYKISSDDSFVQFYTKKNDGFKNHLDGMIYTLQFDDRTNKDEHVLERKPLQLSGDWGVFDSIRTGLNQVLTVVDNVVSSISVLFEPIYDELENIGDTIYSPFSSILSDIENLISGLTADMYNNYLQQPLNDIFNTLSAIPNNVYSAFETLLNAIKTSIENIANQAFVLIEPYIEFLDFLTVFDVITTYITIIINGVIDLFIWLAANIVDIVAFILTTVMDLIDLLIVLTQVWFYFGAILIMYHIWKSDDVSDTLDMMWNIYIKPLRVIIELIISIVQVIADHMPFT